MLGNLTDDAGWKERKKSESAEKILPQRAENLREGEWGKTEDSGGKGTGPKGPEGGKEGSGSHDFI